MIEEQDYIQRLEDEIARLENIINKAIDYIQENYDKDLYDDTLTAFEDNLVKILSGDE